MIPLASIRHALGLGALLLLAGASSYAARPDADRLWAEGQSAFDAGRFGTAVEKWEKALQVVSRRGDPAETAKISIALSSACQALGDYRRAAQLLEAALVRAQDASAETSIRLLNARLGAALILTRELDRADQLLTASLEAAKAAHDLKLQALVWNELGNLRVAQQRFTEALDHYEASAAAALQTNDPLLAAQARCNVASAAARAGQYSRAEELNSEALREIARLSDSHSKAFLLLTAAQTDRQLKLTAEGAAQRLLLRAHASLEQAVQLTGRLDDLSLQTYALGYLAQLYEQDGQGEPALSLTRRAVFVAQQAQLPEALYRWEWQHGRLLKARGDIQPALGAYRRAAHTLQLIRSDVSVGPGNAVRPQSFRESQGPLFLELADLLLMEARSASAAETQQALLREARDTVENLKNVELNDYFCDDCVDLQRSRTRELETVDQHTAVVYLVPLSNRTEILVGVTSGLKQFTANVGSSELTECVTRFRRNLETRTTFGYLAQAQQLYDWLIRPLRPWLGDHHIDTLVFVPDGALRTIPFASLHDGERYLIQDLATAVAPGLSLVAPQSLDRGKKRLLLSGLSESVQGFPALDFVPAEMRALEALYPGERLMNESFTLSELKRKLEEEQFSIVHIASHGQFDRDVRKTFVLTHDTKLTMNTLESLIRPSQYRGRPVELLVLSACQTAAGDDRAALGLAGVAVKAGARSALASLWFVNDQSTSALISGVYEELRRSPTTSKARALQAAQIKLLGDRRYRHPCYWSPFLIIGDWL